MKTIKILGPGCSKCNQMEKVVQTAIKQLNLKINIQKIDNIQEIIKYNVMTTPALIIDEKVVIRGRVPSLSEVKTLLTADACCADADNACCSSDAKDNSGSCCGAETQPESSSCCGGDESSTKKSSCCEPRSGCC